MIDSRYHPPIEVSTHHYPGYGSPESWEVSAVDVQRNVLLETIGCYNAMAAGRTELILEQKWGSWSHLADYLLASSGKKLASPWCDGCGGNTRGGCVSVYEKYFCRDCEKAGKVKVYQAELKAAHDATEAKWATLRADQERARIRNYHDARTGIQLNDQWFVIRLATGDVRISVAYGDSLRERITFTALEWNKLVATLGEGMLSE